MTVAFLAAGLCAVARARRHHCGGGWVLIAALGLWLAMDKFPDFKNGLSQVGRDAISGAGLYAVRRLVQVALFTESMMARETILMLAS